MKIMIPVSVVAVAVGGIMLAGGLRPGPQPLPSPQVVVADDPAHPVYPCDQTGHKGPCSLWRLGTDHVCHWWYVDVGQTLPGARDLGTAPDSQCTEN